MGAIGAEHAAKYGTINSRRSGLVPAVYAFDPGLMTGWALWLDGDHDSGEDDFEGIVTRVHEGIDANIIVAERYVITAETLRKTRQTTALEVIGFLRAHAFWSQAEFYLQAPSDAKHFTTDAQLRAIGWYKTGKGHANDASRHLRLWLTKHGHLALTPPSVVK
jgi:hypothetical protein